MNANLMKLGLIDNIDLFIVPILVGGTATPSLIGGKSIKQASQLNELKTLTLKSVQQIDDSYVRLRYSVNN